MAGEITQTELQNARLDAITLAQAVTTNATITPRTGSAFSSIPKLVADKGADLDAETANAATWATRTGSVVPSTSEYSSKEYAIGTAVSAGSAKQWAAEAEDVVVSGGLFSALHYNAKAAASAAAAQDALNEFNFRYLGPRANDAAAETYAGAELGAGDFYFNTSSNVQRYYTGAGWVTTGAPTATVGIADGGTGATTAAAARTALQVPGRFTDNSFTGLNFFAGVTSFGGEPRRNGVGMAAFDSNVVLMASQYIAFVGSTYTDNADAIQALFNDSASLSLPIIYDTDAEIKGTLYLRDGMRISSCPGVMNLVVDGDWVGKGTSVHKNQAVVLTASSNGDTSYPEATVSAQIDQLYIVFNKTAKGETPYTGIRFTKLRDSFLKIDYKGTGVYASTTADGDQSAGANSITVADASGIEPEDTLVINGNATLVKADWDQVGNSVPLMKELGGGDDELAADVTDGDTVFYGYEQSPIDFYRDNRNVFIDLNVDYDTIRGGIWIREISLDSQEATSRTDTVIGSIKVTQTGENGDEAVAVFTSGTGSGGIYNVVVDIKADVNRRAFGCLNNTNEPPEQMQVTATVDAVARKPAPGTTVIQVKEADCNIPYHNVLIYASEYDGTAPTYGVRASYVSGGSMEPPQISNGVVRITGDTTNSCPVVGYFGSARWVNCQTEERDSGRFQISVQGNADGEVVGGDFCDGTDDCFRNVSRALGGAIVRGRLNGTSYFDGLVEGFDSSKYANVVVSTDADADFYFKGDIHLSTTNALTRVIDASACNSFMVDYRLLLAASGANPSSADNLPSVGDGRRAIVTTAGAVDTTYTFSDANGMREALGLDKFAFGGTPVVYFGTADATAAGTPATFSSRVFEHRVIGDMSFFRFSIAFTAKGTGSGALGVGGFTSGYEPSDFNEGSGGLGSLSNMTGLRSMVGLASNASGTPRITFNQINAAGTGYEQLTDTNVTDTTSFAGTIVFNHG